MFTKFFNQIYNTLFNTIVGKHKTIYREFKTHNASKAAFKKGQDAFSNSKFELFVYWLKYNLTWLFTNPDKCKASLEINRFVSGFNTSMMMAFKKSHFRFLSGCFSISKDFVRYASHQQLMMYATNPAYQSFYKTTKIYIPSGIHTQLYRSTYSNKKGKTVYYENDGSLIVLGRRSVINNQYNWAC